MKVFISVDMEGISGIVHPEDVTPGHPRYEQCRPLITGDCNAAIEGALAAGATQVLVNESHWIMRNLRLEDINPAATVIRGFHKSQCMVEGLDSSFDAAIFVGYHARQGRVGVMSHTLTGREFYNVKINGQVVGELGINALIAAAHGVPVVMVTGDDALCAEATASLGPEVAAVAVKRAIDRYTAECLHPTVAQQRIREAAQQALHNRQQVKLLSLSDRYVIDLELLAPSAAWACSCMPSVERTGDREVRYVAPDAGSIYPFLLAAYMVSSSVADPNF